MKSSGHIGRRLRQRWDALLASAGLAIGVVLCVSSAGSVAWVWWRQEQESRSVAQAQAGQASRWIKTVAEIALASPDLAEARTRISDAAGVFRTSEWSITIPDGRLLASSDPTAKLIDAFPEPWPDGKSAAVTSVPQGASRESIRIEGVGEAELTVRSAPRSLEAWSDPTLLGLAGVGLALTLGWYAAYRRAAARMAGIVNVFDALAAVSTGELAVDALKVDESFGREAGAWNAILDEREASRLRDLEERAGRLLNAAGGAEGSSELGGLCDAMWIGLLIVDSDSRVCYCNGAAATLLNGKRDDFPGRPVDECVIDPHVRSLITKAIAGGLRHRVMHEKQLEQPGAGASTLRFSVKSLRKEDHGAAFIVIEDITQQKVAEESRHSFAAQVTHELRTPLTNMRLYVDTLLEDETNDPQVRARCLNVVSTEIRRLERVVSDMLSVSEMEAGSIQLRRDDVRMDALMEEIEADHRAPAQDKEIALHFDLPPKLPVVDGDRDKISMALHNLLGNAIKYTPAGGEVRVIVTEENGSLAIMVKDNGIGIKPEEAELVFEKFYRAKDKRINGITGSGLGLAIARQVIRLHGGDITVSSQIDRGSTFTLTLPMTGAGGATSVRAAA